jgi:hypothetical protein
MRRATPELLRALRATAVRLAAGESYQWTHQGRCNCGHLARELTTFSAAELHRMALEKPGDWSEKAREYCPSSGYPIDHVIEQMLRVGLTLEDIQHLERLSDPAVLARVPADRRPLRRDVREDVVAYLLAFAAHVESALGRADAVARLNAGLDPSDVAPPAPRSPRRAARVLDSVS